MRRQTAVIVALAWLPACVAQQTATIQAEVTAVLESFYEAIKRGDANAAMSLVAADAVFLESGKLETRGQYEANHLPSDIEFEKQVTGKRGPIQVNVAGDTAWLIATTDYDGTFEGSPVSFVSAQLMVLAKDSGVWRIRSIHWSSRRR